MAATSKDLKKKMTVNLDNMALLEKYDTEDMYHKIIHLPEQIKQAYSEPQVNLPQGFDALLEKLKKNPIRRIIVVGMGGSAISGDILQATFDQTIPIQVYKDYHIPLINEDDLFIACSYSGNTEETVSCLNQAVKRTKNIAAITSNGKVKSIVADNYLWCKLPQGYPPRAAVGYLFFSFLVVLERFKLIPSQQKNAESTISSLMQKAGALSRGVEVDLNLAKQSALALNGKIPLIYASNPALTPVAYRWKCQMNENAKYPAFCHAFPEMNHNEIEAWENKKYNEYFIPVFLSRLNEDHCYQKRISFFKKTMDKEDISYLDFYGEGDSLLEKIFSLIYLGDMISYYLAILQKVDPTAINLITELKKEIS